MVVVVFLLLLSFLAYVIVAKRESKIYDVGQVYRFEKKIRFFARWVIILLLGIFVVLIIYEPSRLYFASTLTGQPIRDGNNAIAIVSGHWESDTGSVCPNGLREDEVNAEIANLIERNLADKDLTVDEFIEFDQRLLEYDGDAIVVLHTGTCQYINDYVTGFYVTGAI